MVDFGELKDKVQGLIADHSDQVKQGIDKIGGVVGDRLGHDRVNQVEDKLSGLVDKISGEHHAQAPAEPPAPTSTGPTVPIAAEPPAAPPPGPDPGVPPAEPGSAG